MNFIYVFRASDRDKLLQAGFRLLKDDPDNHVYIFVNQSEFTFASSEMPYVTTDTLTF